MKLFLDDLRNPPDRTWVVVRSFSEAVRLIELIGFPDEVSFDHDLGDGPTGYDFAHYLVDLDLDKPCMPVHFTYRVHSANPVGSENISRLMDRYLRHRGESEDR